MKGNEWIFKIKIVVSFFLGGIFYISVEIIYILFFLYKDVADGGGRLGGLRRI